MLARAMPRRPMLLAEHEAVPREIEAVGVAELPRATPGWLRCRSRSRGSSARDVPRPRAPPPAARTSGIHETRNATARREYVSSSRRSMQCGGARTHRRRGRRLSMRELERPCYHTRFMRPRGAIEAALVVLAATALTDRRHLSGGVPHRSTRPDQHRRRALEHLGRVMGRAQPDDAAARRLSREHLLPASLRAGVLGSQPRRRRCSARRSGSRRRIRTRRTTSRSSSRSSPPCAGAYYLARYLTGQPPGRGGRRRPLRLLSVHLRAHGAHAAAVHRRAAVLHAGVSPARRCAVGAAIGRRSACCSGRRP